MTIGSRIKQRRLALGLTQSELAQRLGLKSKVSISTVENDKEDLTTDRIRKFAEALDTTPAYLMGWEETPAFRRRHKYSDIKEQTIDGETIVTYKATPTVPQTEIDKLQQAYVDAIYTAKILERYGDLLKDPKVQRLLEQIKSWGPEKIEMALNIVDYIESKKNES
jgi:transcriptional regulator with XRE-family HTH domain